MVSIETVGFKVPGWFADKFWPYGSERFMAFETGDDILDVRLGGRSIGANVDCLEGQCKWQDGEKGEG